MEVIVFPKAYEANAPRLNEGSKVFIEGRVAVEDDRDAKLFASKVLLFDEVQKTVWLRFPNKEAYEAKADAINNIIATSDGKDEVNIYLTNTKQIKKLGKAFSVKADKDLIEQFEALIEKENVQIT